MPVTVLRAAIVVGAGGISWEMTRQLIKNLPAMVVPKWADTRTQPIALDDVIRYLVGVIGVEKAYGQVYEIGGADRLTYIQMLQQAGEVINGRRVPIVTVPVLTPRLSSHWIGLVTNVDSTTASNLIDSMSTEVLQTDYAIQDIVPGEPMTYREAVEIAVGRERPQAQGPSLEEHDRQRPPASSGSTRSASAPAPRIPPDARRSRPTTTPSSRAAKASITLPVARVATP